MLLPAAPWAIARLSLSEAAEGHGESPGLAAGRPESSILIRNLSRVSHSLTLSCLTCEMGKIITTVP